MSTREPGVQVRFFKEDVVHGIMSKSAGREVTVQKDFVEIRISGNDKEIYFGPANEEMQRRFPEEWAAYLKGAGPERIGTPVNRWPQLTQNQVRNLEQHAIYTVEDMAAVTDAGLQNLGMGARKLREDAQKFLSLASAAAEVAQLDELREENAGLKSQLQVLQEQMSEILSRMAKAEEKPAEVVAEAPRKRKAA